MTILSLFDDASRVMTVISFATFMGILAWTCLLREERDFACAANLPFADAGADIDADIGAGDDRALPEARHV